MSRISLQMYTMREHTSTIEGLEKTIEKLSEIGFEMVQYSIPKDYSRETVYKIFNKYNMKNDSVYGENLVDVDMNDVLSQCEHFGTDYVRVATMPPSLTTSLDGFKEYAKFLNDNSKELKAHGKKVLYHFHAFEFRRFGDVSGIETILAETDPEVIQIIPDTHWIQSGGKNPANFLAQYTDRYDLVHFKDFGITERMELLEGRPIVYAPVGEGNLEWDPIIKVCKENNVLSYAIEQDFLYGRDAFSQVKSSFDFMSSKGI